MWPFGKGKSKSSEKEKDDEKKSTRKSGPQKVTHEQHTEDFLGMEFDNINADGTIDMSNMDLAMDMNMADPTKEPEVFENILPCLFTHCVSLSTVSQHNTCFNRSTPIFHIVLLMQMDFDDLDFDDEKLNAAFDNLNDDGDDGGFDLLESQMDDSQFSAEEMSLFAEFEREQGLDEHPDPVAVSALQVKVAGMEAEILDLKKKALVLKQKKDIPGAMELLKQSKLLAAQLTEPQEELSMLLELTARAEQGSGSGTLSSGKVSVRPSSEKKPPRPNSIRTTTTAKSTATATTARRKGKVSSSTASSTSSISAAPLPPTPSATTEPPPRSSSSSNNLSNDLSMNRLSMSSNRLSTCSAISNLTEFTTLSVNEQVFSHLEAAINEGLKLYLGDAKHLKDSDKQKAAKRFTQYKALKNEMGVLQSRKSLPYEVSPPLFQWNTLEQKYFYQDLTLADTDLKIEVQSVCDLSLDHSLLKKMIHVACHDGNLEIFNNNLFNV